MGIHELGLNCEIHIYDPTVNEPAQAKSIGRPRPPVVATQRSNGDAPKEIYGTCDDLWEIYGKCGPGLIWFPKSFFRSPIVGWFLKKYPIAVQPHCDMMMFGGFKNHTLMGL